MYPAIRQTSVKLLKEPKIWLLAILTSLAVTYLNFCWVTRAIYPLAISFIFFSALGISLWKKHHSLSLESDLLSSFLGTSLLAYYLLKISSLTNPSPTLLLLPFIAALGLGLLASGVKGLSQYWAELSIFFALAIPGTNFFLWWLKMGWLNYLISHSTKGKSSEEAQGLHPPKSSSLASLVNGSQLWLISLAISLTLLYLYFLNTTGGISVIDHSILALLAVFWLLWRKRDQLHLNSQLYTSLLGTACLAIAVKIDHPQATWLPALPFFAALGIVLIASGVSALKQYWRELFILLVVAFFGILKQPIEQHFALTIPTAQLSHYLLYMGGIDSLRQGTIIAFSPKNALNVVESCAGYSKIFWLVEISIFYLVLFPSNLRNIFIIPPVATAIAFVSNSVRIAILGAFLAANNEAGFEYWHQGDGSQIFTIIPVVIFGSLCLNLIKR
jgi:cyanoexosortase A